MAAPVDKFATALQGVTSPASSGEAVTPHASTNFAQISRGIYVGGAGDVTAVFPDDTVLTFSGVLAGTLLPIRCKRINAVATTATLMLALY